MTILSRKRLEAAACTCYQSGLDTYADGMAAGVAARRRLRERETRRPNQGQTRRRPA